MNEPGEDNEIKRRAPEQVGDIDCRRLVGGLGITGTEPREQSEHECEHIDDHGLVERLEGAEEIFPAGLVQLRRETVTEPGLIPGHGAVEIVRLMGAVGGDHFRVKSGGGIDFAGAGGLHEVGADVLPVVAGQADVRGRNGQGQGVAGDGLIAAHETEQGVEGDLLVFLSGLAGVHGGDARWNAFLVGVQFGGKVIRGRRFETDFEPLVQIDGLVELHQLRLEDGAFGGIQGFNAADLLIDFVHRGTELFEGIIFLVVGQFEQFGDLVVINAENLPVIGGLGFHHHLKQPVGGGERLRLATGRVINGLFGTDLEQRIAGNGIERLEPAVHEDGQLAEVARVKAGFGRLAQAGQDPPRHHHDQYERNPFFHNFVRFVAVPPCGISPLHFGEV